MLMHYEFRKGWMGFQSLWLLGSSYCQIVLLHSANLCEPKMRADAPKKLLAQYLMLRDVEAEPGA